MASSLVAIPPGGEATGNHFYDYLDMKKAFLKTLLPLQISDNDFHRKRHAGRHYGDFTRAQSFDLNPGARSKVPNVLTIFAPGKPKQSFFVPIFLL